MGLTTAVAKTPLRRFMVGLSAASYAAGPDMSCYHDLGGRPFPSRLPFLPCGSPPASARRRRRWREHRRAEIWANGLWSLFSYYESGSPQNPEKVRAAIVKALRPCGGLAAARFAANLKTSLLPWCRLEVDPTEGRGARSLQEALDRLVTSAYSSVPNVDEMVKTAKEVVADRLSIPEEASTCDPLDFLSPERAAVFRNLLTEVAPLKPPLPGAPRPCHMLEAHSEVAVIGRLIKCGLVVLVPEGDLPRDASGRTLVGGLFSVPHKPLTDRLINDRRALNFSERRLGWAELPHGSQLCSLVLHADETVLADGMDLQNYFYMLRHLPSWVPRNGFGRVLLGENYAAFGARPGQRYYPCFTSVCMGDTNAVDIAMAVHSDLLFSQGCLQVASRLVYGTTTPAGPHWQLLYIDDYVGVGKVPRSLRDRSQPGGVLSQMKDNRVRMRSAYKLARLPVSETKCYVEQETFVALGTEVNGKTGEVGTPLQKRLNIAVLICRLLQLGKCSKKCMQKLLGLINYPFMHRRECMACLRLVFRWLYTFESGTRRITPEVQDELCAAMLLLPVASSNIRWPISPQLSCTDATLTRAGGTRAQVGQDLAESVYRLCEGRGEYVRTDWLAREKLGLCSPVTQMPYPQAEVHQMLRALPWEVSRSVRLGRDAHVNVQELRAMKGELKDLALSQEGEGRHIDGVDSRVALGAWSKGRSSSWQLNAVLQGSMGYSIAGRRRMFGLWTESASNPADDPSREAELRAPEEAAPWLVPFLCVAPSSAPGGTVCEVGKLGGNLIEPAGPDKLAPSVPSHEPSPDLPISKVTSPSVDQTIQDAFPRQVRDVSLSDSYSEHSNSSGERSGTLHQIQCVNKQVKRGDPQQDMSTRPEPVLRLPKSGPTIRPPPGLERPDLTEAARLADGCRLGPIFQEVCSGVGRLSKAFAREGWEVWDPIDAFVNSTYREEHDISRTPVVLELQRRWTGRRCYVHFGMPCSSFSTLNVNFNRGTRTAHQPLGDGSLEREVYGNTLMKIVVKLCRFLLKNGNCVSIENPTCSYLWKCPSLKRLARYPGMRFVRFDQCAHGLMILGDGRSGPCKKDTKILTNAPLCVLERKCPGNHDHVHAKGGVRTKEGWRSLAALAGHYPAPLCRSWAQACSPLLSAMGMHGSWAEAEPSGHTPLASVPTDVGGGVGPLC